MTGRVTGVGTGPGDPELLTRKAVAVIEAADAVFYVEADGKPSRALATVDAFVPQAAARCAISMPMRADPAEGQVSYDRAATEIRDRAKAGQSVAVLCEGDPLLYGSFIYLMDRLPHRPAIVPGVPSFLAAASVLPAGLVRRSESLSLIPGTLSTDAFKQRLDACDCAAILKTGRHLPRVRAALRDSGFSRAHIIVEATTAAQQIVPLEGYTDDTLPYFALILAWKEAAA